MRRSKILISILIMMVLTFGYATNPINKQISRSEGETATDNAEVSTSAIKSNTLYPVNNGFFKWGYIDSDGKMKIDYIYDSAGYFIDGLAVVNIEGKEGFIDTDGNFVIKPEFGLCLNFSEGLAHIISEDEGESKHGFIDKEGNIYYKDYFNNNTGDFHEGLAAFEYNRKYGYVDTKGNIVIEPRYVFAEDFSEGLAMVTNDDLYCGFINKNGELVISYKYEYDPIESYLYQGFSNGLAVVCENGKYGFINKKGDYAIEAKYDFAERFSEGVALVNIGGLWGYIDSNGNEVIKPQYASATSFNNGYAFAKPTDKQTKNSDAGFGIIDKTGRFITATNIIYEKGGGYTFNIEWTNGFHDELARVVLMDNNGLKYVYINKKGKIVWEM